MVATGPARAPRRARPPRGVAWLGWLVLLSGLGWALGIALLAGGCRPAGRATPVEGEGRNDLAPASSADRTAARAARAARAKALADQGDAQPPASQARSSEPPPPPPPEPSAEPAASAAPAEPVDAGVVDASTDAAVATADAGQADPDALCRDLCARAMACALEMLESTGGELPPEIVERMREQMEASEEQCRQECTSQLEPSDAERLARAKRCITEEDCEAFLSCMREVLDE